MTICFHFLCEKLLWSDLLLELESKKIQAWRNTSKHYTTSYNHNHIYIYITIITVWHRQSQPEAPIEASPDSWHPPNLASEKQMPNRPKNTNPKSWLTGWNCCEKTMPQRVQKYYFKNFPNWEERHWCESSPSLNDPAFSLSLASTDHRYNPEPQFLHGICLRWNTLECKRCTCVYVFLILDVATTQYGTHRSFSQTRLASVPKTSGLAGTDHSRE